MALKKGLEDESHAHVFETSKAMFNLRQRRELLQEAMDIGVVFIIFINAIVIGVSIDNPKDRGLWETLELAAGLYVKRRMSGARSSSASTCWNAW